MADPWAITTFKDLTQYAYCLARATEYGNCHGRCSYRCNGCGSSSIRRVRFHILSPYWACCYGIFCHPKKIRYFFLSRPHFAGDLQSLSWSSMAVGGVFGSLLGGYALSNLPIHAIYVVFSALPFFQLVACMFVDDSPKGFQSAIDQTNYVQNQSAENGSTEALGYQGTRRRKGTRQNSKRKPLSKQTEANDSASPCLSPRSAFVSLCTAFKQPSILR